MSALGWKLAGVKYGAVADLHNGRFFIPEELHLFGNEKTRRILSATGPIFEDIVAILVCGWMYDCDDGLDEGDSSDGREHPRQLAPGPRARRIRMRNR
jgi:hypothetical protein